MPHVHFIVNPVAGGNTCLLGFQAVEEELRRRGADYSVAYSEYPEHASELARQALVAGRDRIVAVGGDGTVREIARELVHTGVPMGILPMGSGNDMVRSLGVPGDALEALGLLLQDNARPVDAAMAGDQLYLNVSGLGFDVEVLERTRSYKKWFRGGLSYFLGVLHALFYRRPHRVRVTTDKGVLEEDILLLAVGNGTHMGGGMNVTPLADVSDGLLDVCIIGNARGLRIPFLLTKVLRGRHLDLKEVRYFQTDVVSVECGDELKVQLDGEIIGRTPVTFRVLPGALRVLTGQDF